jgi:hypothetical protein
MSAQSAKVVSLEDFRHARNAQHAARPQQTVMPVMAPMAWVPVWFMPVYWVGTPPTLN